MSRANRPRMPRADARELPRLELDPPARLATVAVRASGRHPLVFRKMVIGPTGQDRPANGDLVRVVDRDAIHLGYGFWNARSQIPVRLLSRAAAPPDHARWEASVREAVHLRRSLLELDSVTDAYRVIHAEADGLTGLVADRFGDVLSVELFCLGMHLRSGPVLDLLMRCLGTRHARVQVDARSAEQEGMPPAVWSSPELPESVAIQEHGVRYRIRFEGAHKTGFFCDQRDNRLRLARYCRDRDVLDLCCYTGGFALNARVRGQAREVTAVDLDETAIALARENANLNQVRFQFVHADAFGYARQMGVNQKLYGVVVLDPPKLIPSRADIETGERKYLDLNTLALRLVEPGGILLTCSCSGLLSAEQFLFLIRNAARRAGREVRILELAGAAPDHPVGIETPESSYLKAAWLRVGEPLPDSQPPQSLDA